MVAVTSIGGLGAGGVAKQIVWGACMIVEQALKVRFPAIQDALSIGDSGQTVLTLQTSH